MTYRQEMYRLASAARELVREGGQVPAVDIPAALVGHCSVAALLCQVDRDIGMPRWEVRELGKLLARQPRMIDQPLSAVLDAAAAGRAGHLWREVARAATVAHHDWRQSLPVSRPFGKTSWSEVSDVASLAEALACLDGDLADSLLGAGRWSDAQRFAIDQPALLSAARSVRLLTASGPLPRARELEAAPAGRVLVGLTPTSLPQAVRRLSALLIGTGDIAPLHIELISRAAAETVLAAASSLGQARACPPTDVLREHASCLAAVGGLSGRIVALQAGDGRPLEQASQIHLVLANLQKHGGLLPVPEARVLVHTIPALTRALTSAAEWQIRTKQWLLPEAKKRQLQWSPCTSEDDEPAMLHQLRAACRHAQALDQDAHRNWRLPKPRVTLAPPRELLQTALTERNPAGSVPAYEPDASLRFSLPLDFTRDAAPGL
jgi:hypothetical protein